MFLVHRTVLKNVKEFSRIVCVSLFSYQGFCLCDSFYNLSHLQDFVNNFFKFFKLIFQSCFDYFSDVFAASLTTYTLYHVISLLSSFILNFLKYYLFVSIPETFICDSSIILSYHVVRVNTFFIFFYLFLHISYQKNSYLSGSHFFSIITP